MEETKEFAPEELAKVKTEFEKQTEQAQEVAAKMMGMYTPKFELAISQLSNNALRRVINALISYPLEEPPRFMDNGEKNAFLIGNKLLETKYTLIIGTLLASQQITNELQNVAEQAAQTEAPASAEVTVNNENGEEKNV